MDNIPLFMWQFKQPIVCSKLQRPHAAGGERQWSSPALCTAPTTFSLPAPPSLLPPPLARLDALVAWLMSLSTTAFTFSTRFGLFFPACVENVPVSHHCQVLKKKNITKIRVTLIRLVSVGAVSELVSMPDTAGGAACHMPELLSAESRCPGTAVACAKYGSGNQKSGVKTASTQCNAAGFV
jgi:hypothetical protein